MLDETRASRVTPGDKIRGQAPSEGEFPGAWIWCLVNWVVPAEEGWWCHLMGIRRGDLRWLLLKEIWDDRLLLKAQQSQSTQCLPLMSLATSWDIYSSHNPIKTFPAQGWHQLARYAHCTRQIHQQRMFSCGLPACYTCLVIISCVNIHATCQKDLQSWKKSSIYGDSTVALCCAYLFSVWSCTYYSFAEARLQNPQLTSSQHSWPFSKLYEINAQN